METKHTNQRLNASCVSTDSNCTCGLLFDDSGRAVAKVLFGESGTNGMDPDITVEEMKANSSHLAHCWNLHPQLLEALRRLLASHKDLIWSLDNGGRPDMEWTMEIQVVAEEAISLATGSEVDK